MNTSTRDPHFTLRIENALRCLVKHPTHALRYLERRYDIESGSLAVWLAEFNNGEKALTDARVDAVKAELGTIASGSASADVKPRISNGFEKLPPVGVVVNCDETVKIVSTKPPVTVVPMSALKPTQPTSDIGRWLENQRVKICGRVNCFQVEVTPELATAWLRFNQGNRSPSKAKIRRFVDAIKNGQWTLNGETIKFSVSGQLLDGQSRLQSIIDAGVPVVLEVRGGLPEAVQKTMDCGELRKTSHTLEMLGEKSHPFEYAAALKLCWLLERDMLGGKKFKTPSVMENAEVPAMLQQHAGLRGSVAWMSENQEKIVLLMPKSEAAFFHYIFGVVDSELRDHFCEAMVEGANLTKFSPIFHLRNALLQARVQGAARALARDRRALIIKAWNATHAGEKLTSLRFLAGEQFPLIAGSLK